MKLPALRLLVTVTTALLLVPQGMAQPAADPAVSFGDGVISGIAPVSEGREATVRNGVKLDVFFDRGTKGSVAIYAINTGRKQLVLTPAKHRAILENLLRKKFTVVVADFRDKRLDGIELEKYVVQLTADVREAVDGIFPPKAGSRPPPPSARPATSRTGTFASDYYVLMPGFTVERDVAWFRYGDIPEPFRKALAAQLGRPFQAADADVANTYDIIYPVHGPAVGVLTNYGSNEKGREDFYATDQRFLVMAFAFKNLAIVHQQYFTDPAGGYPKGYGYYGDQFAVNFIRHLKGNAARYHLNVEKICCFGHSKGSEVPGMLVNRLRDAPPYLRAKVDFKKLNLAENERSIPSPFPSLSTEIAGAIFGAGVGNQEVQHEKLQPWSNRPAANISPFFIYADHRADTRQHTHAAVAKARAHGVTVETAEQEAHTWPIGGAYEKASAFVDRILGLRAAGPPSHGAPSKPAP